MSSLRKHFRNFVKDERGQSVVEYGLICLLIALAALAGFQALGSKVSTVLASLVAAL